MLASGNLLYGGRTRALTSKREAGWVTGTLYEMKSFSENVVLWLTQLEDRRRLIDDAIDAVAGLLPRTRCKTRRKRNIVPIRRTRARSSLKQARRK